MTVASSVHSCLSSQSNPSTFVQCSGLLDGKNVTYFPGSRLIENSDGSIYLIPKAPSEVLGEKLLRPLIYTISTLASKIFSYIPPLPSLPVASAEEVTIVKDEDCFPPEEILLSCLENNPLTATYDHFNKAFASRLGGKSAIAEHARLGVLLTIADLQMEYEFPYVIWDSVRVIYEKAFEDCPKNPCEDLSETDL